MYSLQKNKGFTAFKKTMMVFLAFCMICGLTTFGFVYASSPVQIEEIIESNFVEITEENGIRIARSYDGNKMNIAVFNSIERTICFSIRDLDAGITLSGPTMATHTNLSVLPSATNTRGVTATIHQDTFSNYEYDIYTGNPNEWNLERPDDDGQGQRYFMVYENSSNDDELQAWFEAVNDLNDKEWEAVSVGGLGIVADCIAGFLSGMAVASGGILSPAAISAIIAAVGATGNASYVLAQVGTLCNVCMLAYQDVYNATDNMHF